MQKSALPIAVLARTLIRAIAAWVRSISDIRLTVILLAAGGWILTLDQGKDVVRALADDANLGSLRHLPPTSALMQWVFFWLACVWSGLNAWYWSNLLYRTKPIQNIDVGAGTQAELDTPPQPTWFRCLRRALGLLPLGSALFAILVCSPGGLRDVWIVAAVFAATAVGLLWFFVNRHTLFTKRDSSGKGLRSPGRLEKIYEAMGGRGKPNLIHADDYFVGTSIAIALSAIVFLSIPGLRTHIAWIVGPAALAFGAVGCILPYTSLLIWLTRGIRLPVVAVGIVALILFSMVNDNHEIRVLAGQESERRPSIDDALERWTTLHKDTDPLILVATAGGASRAAYWTGAVLSALDENTNGFFSKSTFAISSVSGGTLGAVGYAAWLSDHQQPRDQTISFSSDFNRQRQMFLRAFLGDDYLGPAVAGLLFPDLLQRFLPIALLPSRATSLEESWEMGWARANLNPPRTLPRASQQDCDAPPAEITWPALAPKQDERFNRSFVEIWNRTLMDQDLAHSSGWVPIVLANGTHAETGKRVITSPVRIESDVFEDSYDFYTLVNKPIRASTAVLNSARFPLVSPPGRLPGECCSLGHIVDGGYFENGGLETLYDLALYIHARQPSRQVMIVEINNDDAASSGDIARHTSGAKDAAKIATGLPVTPPATTPTSPILNEFVAIGAGLYNTRIARGILAAKRISSSRMADKAHYYHFQLSELRAGQKTAMSWALSRNSRLAMDMVFNPSADPQGTVLDACDYKQSRLASLNAELQDVYNGAAAAANRATMATLISDMKAPWPVADTNPLAP